MGNENARARYLREKALMAAKPATTTQATDEAIRAAYERNYTGSNRTSLSWSAFKGGWRACERAHDSGVKEDQRG